MQKQQLKNANYKCLPKQDQTKPYSSNITIPRYSDRFKDIIAKSQLTRKQCQTTQPQSPCEPKQEDFFFFRVKSIGVGAHSFVYLVQEQRSKMLLSQKSITKSHAKQIQQDLTREIKILSHTHHVNIIELYHFYQTETHINLVMQFAEDSLFALKQRFGIFKQKQTIEITRQLLLALKYLHQKHIVHADVKLQNVMISNGTIKLVDFGLAHTQTTKTHQEQPVVGTMEYLPPQYAQGIDSGTHRDIWAVGILAFEMSVGLKQNQKWSKLVKNPPSALIQQLEEQHRSLGVHSEKIVELVRGILVPYQKRQSAQQLLKLPFFCQ